MSCNCNKPKCDGKCGVSPSVLQINNPGDCTLFHRVEIPASMGDSTTNPPKNGDYRNVLLYYVADGTSWLFSSDGIPQNITGERGPIGPQGPAGTIAIGTTTTGATGEDAKVENVGTPENAILNFTIPRGEQGEQGIQGETGPQGYMNEQDVRDVVDTIVPEDFFSGDAVDTICDDVIDFDGAIEGDPASFEMRGNTTQASSPSPSAVVAVKTVTGENAVNAIGESIFNQDSEYQQGYLGSSGNIVSSSTNVAGVEYFAAKPETTYYASYNVVSAGTFLRGVAFYRGDKTFISRVTGADSGELTVFTTPANTVYIRAYFQNADGLDVENFPESYLTNIQIKDNQSADYVPYDGKTYTLNLGKNLFNKYDANIIGATVGSTMSASPNNKTLYIRCEPNTAYTVQKRNDGDTNRFTVGTTSVLPADGVSVSNNVEDRDAKSITITTGSSAKYLVVQYFRIQETVLTEQQVLDSIQIEVGKIATSYAGYFDPIELCKVGDHQDYIWNDNGTWKLHKAIGKYVYNNDLSQNGLNTSRVAMLTPALNIDPNLADDSGVFFSNMFTPTVVNETGIKGTTSTSKIRVQMNANIVSTYDDFKALAAANNLTIYYPLATESDTIITNDELISQLDSIKIDNNKAYTISGSNAAGEICIGVYNDNWNGNLAAIDRRFDELEKSGTVKYIFPKNLGATGDYNIIQVDGKNILIDSFVATKWEDFKAVLDSYDIKHIDIFICSHFHADHIGNFRNLVVNGYIDHNTDIYFPKYTESLWTEDSSYTSPHGYHEAMDTVAEYDLDTIQPTEDMVVRVADDADLTFYNTDDELSREMFSQQSYYNNASVVVKFRHGSKYIMYWGDCYDQPVRWLYGRGKIPSNIAIWKMGHHAIDYSNFSYFDVLMNLHVDYAVAEYGLDSMYRGQIYSGGNASSFQKMGVPVLVSAYNQDSIEFSTYKDSLSLLRGVEYPTAEKSRHIDVTYYVDSTNYSTVKQDGTQDYPFSNLSQCIGNIDKNNSIKYTIILNDGEYNNQFVSYDEARDRTELFGVTNTVTIVGNSEDPSAVILRHGFRIANCSNVTIRDLTIYNGGESNGIDIDHSNVTLENITYYEDTADAHRIVVRGHESTIYINNMSADKIAHAIKAEYCNITVNTFSITNTIYTAFNLYDCIMSAVGCEVTDNSAALVINQDSAHKSDFLNGISLWSGSKAYDSVTPANNTFQINSNYTIFKNIMIKYTSDGTRSVIVPVVNSLSTEICTNHSNSQYQWLSQMKLSFSGRNVTLSDSRQYRLDMSDITQPITSTTSNITITEILGL